MHLIDEGVTHLDGDAGAILLIILIVIIGVIAIRSRRRR
jgi:uncharacterized membrane protein